MSDWESVLRGGRVIDPESGLDAVRDVAVAQGRIAAIGTALPPGRADVDVSGQVVTAGFVDLHSHVGDLGGLRLQAMDGVTTALELEAGVTPVAEAYRRAAEQGRPINYGFAASWALARMEAVAGLPPMASLAGFMARISVPAWQQPAGPAAISALLNRLSADLADGALGIGVLLGYAPATSPAGTFCRALRLLTRAGGDLAGDGGALTTHGVPFSLAQALAKCSLEPARLLEDRVPALRRKGRLQAGLDADIVVFDPETISDRASYRHSTLPSAGIRHVLVNGTFVVRGGEIAGDARPGRPVRADPR